MTRERAKELLPFIAAYAEGKTIQIYTGSYWADSLDPIWTAHGGYRIKPTPKLRPFRRGEIKCGDVVKTKEIGSEYLVISVTDRGIGLMGAHPTFEDLITHYTMADGSPCGKEEEV